MRLLHLDEVLLMFLLSPLRLPLWGSCCHSRLVVLVVDLWSLHLCFLFTCLWLVLGSAAAAVTGVGGAGCFRIWILDTQGSLTSFCYCMTVALGAT